MNKYEWILRNEHPTLIDFFKKWHLNGKSGNGDLFARIIIGIYAQTGMSNAELAKELGISKGLVSQAKSYLGNASDRLIEYVQKNLVGISTAYGLARIENYEEYDFIIPEWVHSRFGLPHSRTAYDPTPSWIREILSCAVPHFREVTEGKFKGQFFRWGFIIPQKVGGT